MEATRTPEEETTAVTLPESSNHIDPKKTIIRKPFGGRQRKRQLQAAQGQLAESQKALRTTRDSLVQTTVQLTQTEQVAREAQENTLIDHLTGLHNKKWFDEEAARKFADARRHKRGLWVIYMDVDRFKKINDRYGHPVGDKILRAFGLIGSREEEPVARIGGEEFAQIVSDGMELEAVQRLVSRYSLNFKEASKEILGQEETLSFGIARMEPGDTPEIIRERADAALYHSKKTGRNKATLFGAEQGSRTSVRLLSREQLSPRPIAV